MFVGLNGGMQLSKQRMTTAQKVLSGKLCVRPARVQQTGVGSDTKSTLMDQAGVFQSEDGTICFKTSQRHLIKIPTLDPSPPVC